MKYTAFPLASGVSERYLEQRSGHRIVTGVVEVLPLWQESNCTILRLKQRGMRE
jgi:hypothetical protein